MSFFKQFLHFLKNFHPIKSFARPISTRTTVQTTIASEFASVPLSYEALKEEVIETPHVSEYHVTETFNVPQQFPAFESEAEKIQARELNGEEEYTSPVIVIRKLEVRPEESLVLASDIEEPLAPDTVISDIVDLTQFQNEPEPEAEAEESLAEAPTDLVMVETETVISEPVEKKPKKKGAVAKTKKPSKSARSGQASKKTTKSVKTPATAKAMAGKAKKTVSRKKTSTPKEAMGFGF